MSIRKHFIEQISEYVKADNGKSFFYLCSADLSEFKQINYHYGFEAGDQLLEDLADFISRIPNCVFCKRIMSDRFFFLIQNETELTEEKLLAGFDNWWNLFACAKQPHFPICTLKLWCGIYPIDHADISLALDNADMARLKARETRSDAPYFFSSSIIEEVREHKKIESEALQALKENRFTYYLQPQVNLRTGEIVGAEALARGFKPNGELIPASSFIPALEKNGVLIELDFLILDLVCQTIRDRMNRNLPVIRISVNLSRLHLRQPKTVERIHSIVTSYHIPPEYLMFELTEDVILNSFSAATEIGSALLERGYKVSIDDFGAGFAGIDACRYLVFNELKLDRSFLEYTQDDEYERNKIIMEGLIGIMSKLNVDVICEGVETAEQCLDLLEMNCHIVQGFYFSKPMPYDRFYAQYKDLDGRYPLSYLTGSN